MAEGPRKVLYVLDADLFFGTAVETARLAHQLYGELPPLLVVGIAYGEEPGVQGQLRTRDFTPSADPGFDRMTASFPGFEPLLPEGERKGGAERFLDFLHEEDPAVPMLAAYRLVSNTQELGRRLEARQRPGLQVTVDVLEGESHTSAVPVSLARGLRALFR